VWLCSYSVAVEVIPVVPKSAGAPFGFHGCFLAITHRWDLVSAK